ncbi:hypothetical protein BHE74_00032410 [Ensete ventricosum]|nr:hypothetical protein BHE74_00032410 [Ensete ventricosum]
MASEKEASRGLEWQVTVPGGSSVKLETDSVPTAAGWRMRRLASALVSKVFDFASKVRKIAADDPRKVVHCLKVGLALALVSVFYYTRPLYDGVGGAAMWAVMTVVVVFEFTLILGKWCVVDAGGSLYKGLNRATATLSAGSVAFGIHWLAIKSGRTADHIILGASVFLLCKTTHSILGLSIPFHNPPHSRAVSSSSASAATFSKFIPAVKARFDYGVTIFILTFNLVAVSSYRVEKLLALAQWRFCTITIGFCICLTVCVVIRPVWAGEELHRLVMRNMEKLADSLEGTWVRACMHAALRCSKLIYSSCKVTESVAEYLEEEEEGGVDCNQKLGQKSQGYRCVLNSKSSEDSLPDGSPLMVALALNIHGDGTSRSALQCGNAHTASNHSIVASIRRTRYIFFVWLTSYKTHLKIDAGKLALQQPPNSVKKHLAKVYAKVATESSKVLKELASSFRSMRKPSSIDYLVEDMKNTADELQNALGSLPQEATSLIIETLPLITAASLLIEVSARVEGVVHAVKEITALPCFKPADGEELKAWSTVA